MGQDQDIQPFDMHRIFIGDLHWMFTLEIVFRTVIIYSYALLLIRWLGRRAVNQLSLVEFLLVIALGSAVGDPMFYPDVPLIHAAVVITVVVLLNRSLDLLFRIPKVEKAVEGSPILVIVDGVVNVEQVNRLLLTPNEIFAQLRVKGIESLGEVREAYIEPSGQMSVFKYPHGLRIAGLNIVPPGKTVAAITFQKGESPSTSSTLACAKCGTLLDAQANKALEECSHCGNEIWTLDVAPRSHPLEN